MILFWERGYDGVSTRELGEAMGISAPSLYSAFASKQKLFEEVVQAYSQRFAGFVDEALEVEPDARSAARHLLTGAAHLYTRSDCPAGCLVMNGATNYSPSSKKVAAGLRAVRHDISLRVQQKIQADIDESRLPADLSAKHLATHTLAIWQGMSLLARDGSDRAELEGAIDMFLTSWPAPPPRTARSRRGGAGSSGRAGGPADH